MKSIVLILQEKRGLIRYKTMLKDTKFLLHILPRKPDNEIRLGQMIQEHINIKYYK